MAASGFSIDLAALSIYIYRLKSLSLTELVFFTAPAETACRSRTDRLAVGSSAKLSAEDQHRCCNRQGHGLHDPGHSISLLGASLHLAFRQSIFELHEI